MELEKADPLDHPPVKAPVKKKLLTITFLVIGGLIIVFTHLFAAFWGAIGLSKNETIWLALSLIISFGINLSGFIVGFVERKKNPKRALFGIIGNGLLVLFFIFIVAYSLSLPPDVP